MSEVGELPALTAERHRRLVDLLGQEGAERQFLRETLELWREHLGAAELAAYLPGDRGFECCARVDGGSFPESFGELSEAGFPSRRVGQGVLLVRGGDPEGQVPPVLSLLLAAGLRFCRLRSRLEQHDFDARLRGVEMEALYDLGLAINSTLDLTALTEEILLRAVSLLDARRGALFLLDGDAYRRQGTIGGAARPDLPRSADPATAELLPGARHLLVVPIEIEGRRQGLLAVADKESRRGVGPFEPDDRRSLGVFANQAAIALEQARLHREALEKERLEREIELASQIQRGILPRALPQIAGWDLLGWTVPARHVGGDYYDVMTLEDGSIALVVGDVSGKGVPAALLVSTLHAALRLLIDRTDGFETVCGKLNAHFLEFSASNKFVTLLLARLHPETGRVEFVNAGHNPGLLIRADGSTELLEAGGLPLGLLPAVTFRQGRTELASGDLLCLYSDGVTEATAPDDEEFGLDRFATFLTEHHHDGLGELQARLAETLRVFTRGAAQGDDQTVVLVRRGA